MDVFLSLVIFHSIFVSCAGEMVYVCPSEALSIDCFDGKVVIFEEVFFGASTNYKCSLASTGSSNCTTPDVLATLTYRCYKKQSCYLSYSSLESLLIDSCPGVAKYLYVRYSCVSSYNIISICDENFSWIESNVHEEKYVTSPNYPYTYGSGKICRKKLKGKLGQSLSLDIIDIYLEHKSQFDLCYDSLVFNRGNHNTITYCSREKERRRWTHQLQDITYLDVTFESSEYHSRRGFLFKFKAIGCAYSALKIPLNGEIAYYKPSEMVMFSCLKGLSMYPTDQFKVFCEKSTWVGSIGQCILADIDENTSLSSSTINSNPDLASVTKYVTSNFTLDTINTIKSTDMYNELSSSIGNLTTASEKNSQTTENTLTKSEDSTSATTVISISLSLSSSSSSLQMSSTTPPSSSSEISSVIFSETSMPPSIFKTSDADSTFSKNPVSSQITSSKASLTQSNKSSITSILSSISFTSISHLNNDSTTSPTYHRDETPSQFKIPIQLTTPSSRSYTYTVKNFTTQSNGIYVHTTQINSNSKEDNQDGIILIVSLTVLTLFILIAALVICILNRKRMCISRPNKRFKAYPSIYVTFQDPNLKNLKKLYSSESELNLVSSNLSIDSAIYDIGDNYYTGISREIQYYSENSENENNSQISGNDKSLITIHEEPDFGNNGVKRNLYSKNEKKKHIDFEVNFIRDSGKFSDESTLEIDGETYNLELSTDDLLWRSLSPRPISLEDTSGLRTKQKTSRIDYALFKEDATGTLENYLNDELVSMPELKNIF